MLGRVTRRNMVHAPAPSERAASSSSLPCCCMSGINSRTTNGKVMNKVASTMPGRANRMRTFQVSSRPANQPWVVLNNSTRHRPATTGDTANGRSISDSSNFLKRNSKRVTAHAISVPKTALTGITIAAVNKVSRSAERASGSRRAAHHALKPSPNAAPSTISSGSTTRPSMISTASTISAVRSHVGECRAPSTFASAKSFLPALVGEQRRNRVDRQQADERRRQQQRGDGDGAVVVVLLQADGDQQRRDLGRVGLVAGDEDHRAVLAQRAREGEREAGEQGRQQFRQDHPAQRGEARGTQR